MRELKVTLSDKVDQKLISYGASTQVKPEADITEELDKFSDKVQAALDKKTGRNKPIPQPAPVQQPKAPTDVVEVVNDMLSNAFPDVIPQTYQAPQQQAQSAPQCAFCGTRKDWVKPGVSKKTGKAYNGFWACKNKCK